MRNLYLILILFFSVFIVSCASADDKGIGTLDEPCFEDNTCGEGLICKYDKCVEDKCLKVECDTWLSCNPQTGECDTLNEGFCLENKDCNSGNNEYCDLHHKCVVRETSPCDSEPCKNNTDGKTTCVEYSNEDGYICMEPDNSKCTPNPCQGKEGGLTRCVVDGETNQGYYCDCEYNYVLENGVCVISCNENCEERNMTCHEFHGEPVCAGGTGADTCDLEQMVKIDAAGVWIGTTENMGNNYSEPYCGERDLSGMEVFYVLRIYEDIPVSLTLEFNDENALLAIPVLYVFNSECSLLDNSLAENVCIAAKDGEKKITLKFEKTLPGTYYIVVDSVEKIGFDYNLIVDF